MVYKVNSGKVGGVFGKLVTVEVDASSGLPTLELIGLLSSEVKEAKERVRVSLKNNNVSLPAMRITVNLSPADEHKAGTAFDLPIAVAILGVFGYITEFKPEETVVVGELSLDGTIKHVRGVLPITVMAQKQGFRRIIVPMENAGEASLIKDIEVIAVSSLSELILYLNTPEEYKECVVAPVKCSVDFGEAPVSELDFSDVYGQESVKRAAGIAAAGFHHLLMIGPPGTGKSLIAKRIPGIMPRLTYEESLEVTTIYSIAGLLSDSKPFIKQRPFWSPHHGASSQSLAGGGHEAMPGLVSLSHRGILFLDELPEFKRQSIDFLRQPLEDGEITISRASKNVKYPAGFMLVGAMNPCPCGYYPDRNRCMCTAPAIERYMSKISGPILDRIDLCVEVGRMAPQDIKLNNSYNTSSEFLRKKVERAVMTQKERYKNENFKFNSYLPSSLVDKYIPLGEKEKDFLYGMYSDLQLSMRSFYKILRVARTIADFDGDERVTIKHLSEASCYRFPQYVER